MNADFVTLYLTYLAACIVEGRRSVILPDGRLLYTLQRVASAETLQNEVLNYIKTNKEEK